MALIACPDCGRSVSSSAASCPGCGHPVKQTLESRAAAEDRARDAERSREEWKKRDRELKQWEAKKEQDLWNEHQKESIAVRCHSCQRVVFRASWGGPVWRCEKDNGLMSKENVDDGVFIDTCKIHKGSKVFKLRPITVLECPRRRDDVFYCGKCFSKGSKCPDKTCSERLRESGGSWFDVGK